MEHNEEGLQPDAIASKWLFLFFLIVFGLAWSLFALFIFANGWVVETFGELSGRHPLFILAVYAPAIAALLLIGFTLVGEGFGLHIPKGYIYFAMAFSTFVDLTLSPMLASKILPQDHRQASLSRAVDWAFGGVRRVYLGQSFKIT